MDTFQGVRKGIQRSREGRPCMGSEGARGKVLKKTKRSESGL